MTGVFGGTFDPPHAGHLALAQAGCRELELDHVLWVVTGDPPHKAAQKISAIEDRLAMVELMLAGQPQQRVSNADFKREGPHYALGTMHWLHANHPGVRWAYLMGEDSLRDLASWHRPAAFVSLCEMLGVMERSGIDIDWEGLERSMPGLRSKVRFFKVEEIELRSRDLRERVRAGDSIAGAVHPDVEAYILSHSLYTA